MKQAKTAVVSASAWLIVGMSVGLFVLTAMAADTSPATAPSDFTVPPRDLLANGNDTQYWIAQIHSIRGDDTKYDQTLFSFRNTFGDWAAMPPVVGRVVGMADSSGEMLFVLESGQWEIMDADEVRSGPSPPGQAVLAIANDDDSVWALIHGAAPSTAPSTQLSDAATQPTTLASVATTQPASNRYVACKFQSGKWGNVYALPDGVPTAPARLSMTVINQLPVIAWTAHPGVILVSRLTADHLWSTPVSIARSAPVKDFKLLNLENKAALWIASSPAGATTAPSTRPTIPDSAGELLTGEDFSNSVPLRFKSPQTAQIAAQSFAIVGGMLRWLGAKDDGSLLEQTFDLSGHPAQVSVVAGPKPEQIVLTPWDGGAALLVVGAVVAAMRQKSEGGFDLPKGRDEVRLRLAPIGVRFAAGLFDLAPLVAVAAIVHPAAGANVLSGIDRKSFGALCELATFTYLLHTTIAELICGQSLGKMLFGLRVIGPEGNEPTGVAILTRNLMRVLDLMLLGLPLLMIVFLPLRQRAGDIVGGTVVIARDIEPPAESDAQ